MNVSRREFYLLILLLALVWAVFGTKFSDFELQRYLDAGLARINKKTGETHIYIPSDDKVGGWMYIRETNWQTASKAESQTPN